MIEQKNISLQHLRIGIQLEFDTKQFFNGPEQFYRTVVKRYIKIGPVFGISRLFHSSLLFS